MSDDEFAADVEALRRGGVNLDQVGKYAGELHDSCTRISALGVTAFGEDDDVIGGPAKKTIKPSQDFAEGVFRGLGSLTEGHVENVGAATNVIGGVVTGTVEVAGGHHA